MSLNTKIKTSQSVLYANFVAKNLSICNFCVSSGNKIDKNCYCDNNYVQNIYDESIGALDNDNILLDGDNFLVNFYGGLLDDLKSAKSIKDNQLSFPS